MSEARELLGRFLNRLLATQTTLIAAADLKAAMTFGEIAEDVQDALAAARDKGWVMVPVTIEAENARMREALGELDRAWDFFDRVGASPPDERAAVGSDHHKWCERAARAAIRALKEEP